MTLPINIESLYNTLHLYILNDLIDRSMKALNYHIARQLHHTRLLLTYYTSISVLPINGYLIILL